MPKGWGMNMRSDKARKIKQRLREMEKNPKLARQLFNPVRAKPESTSEWPALASSPTMARA